MREIDGIDELSEPYECSHFFKETEEQKRFRKQQEEYELELVANKPIYFKEAEKLGGYIQELYESWPQNTQDEQFRIIYEWGAGPGCLVTINHLGLINQLTPEEKQQFIALIADLKKYIPLLQEMELAVPEYLWKTEEYFTQKFDHT